MRLRIVSYASVWGGRRPTATLESGTPLKLEMLHLVADLLVDRQTITELQRADGRIPGQPDARGKPKRFERWLKSGIVDLTCVRKHRQPHRLIARLRARQRNKHLGVGNDFAPAANGVSLRVLRTERSSFEASHRPDATSIIRLEEGKRFVAQAAAVASLAAQHQHRAERQRCKPLNKIVGLVI